MIHLAKPKAISVALALALGLGASGGYAQGADQADLEARIAELEATVQRLAGMLETQQQEVRRVAESSQNAVADRAPATTVTPASNPGTRFTFGGFIRVNATYTDFSDGNPAPGSVARDFHLPGAIPVGGNGESATFDGHAKFSRLLLGSDTTLENGKTISARIEYDFGVLNGGDERATNRYVPSLRRAFLSYDKWLIGQEWSNFMDLGILPETTDFVGPTEGLVFNRQAQLRYSSGPWSVSLENPETTLRPFGGGGRIINDDNNVPDLTVRYKHAADWGYFTAAGIVRQLKYQTATGSDSASGYGISVAAKVAFGADDLRWTATLGSGIGRYVGINYFDDAVLDGNGDIEPIDVFATALSYRHYWTGKWRSSVALGYAHADNDSSLTGDAANAEAYSLRANLFYSPTEKFDVGIELSTATRELENGSSGSANRVDVVAKHVF